MRRSLWRWPARLCAAFDRLPIASVILGWNLSDVLQQACAQEIDRAGAQLYLWHPLPTSDVVTAPRPECRVIGLSSAQIAADLDAFRWAAADGLALSWHLWRMPDTWLDLVRRRFCEASTD